MYNEKINESPCEIMANAKVTTRFKEIEKDRILDIEKYDILPIGTDEIFVQIENSNTHYISNYGRCISKLNKTKIINGKISKGRILYQIYIWKNGERVSKDYFADYLVVKTFKECPKQYNKNCIWHSGDNLQDNYYRNLYPLSKRGYSAVKEFYDKGGYDSEENIAKVLEDNVYNVPTVRGVGYWGMPNVDVHHWTYIRWSDMLMRCYSDKFHLRQPNYVGYTVAKEWHNYANFKRWAEENFYQIDDEQMELDKDILKKGNTVYSSENCIFVPKTINSLIINCKAVRGDYPVGVDKIGDEYRARLSTCTGKQKVIGMYPTPEEAFVNYKECKEKSIKEVAEKYKGKIPEKLYDALLNWNVEIDD